MIPSSAEYAMDMIERHPLATLDELCDIVDEIVFFDNYINPYGKKDYFKTQEYLYLASLKKQLKLIKTNL